MPVLLVNEFATKIKLGNRVKDTGRTMDCKTLLTSVMKDSLGPAE